MTRRELDALPLQELPRLTRQQELILDALVLGLTYAEVGQRLGISEYTVRNHLTVIRIAATPDPSEERPNNVRLAVLRDRQLRPDGVPPTIEQAFAVIRRALHLEAD
jgi:DNA-binding CsgD family transcriptional regulator